MDHEHVLGTDPGADSAPDGIGEVRHAVPARVSVIIPARNADKYIVETFDSLLAQTDPSWQAIVINDKSTDGTQAIIDDYAARHPDKFLCFTGPGVGVSSARNLGLDKASGQRIMFLDSDDWVDPRWLELMNAAMDRDPSAVAAFCGFKRVMVDGQTHDMPLYHGLTEDPFGVMARVCAVGIHSVLLDRAALEAVGRFDTTMRNCEDWDLWLRIARRPGRWVEVNQYLSYYRCGHTSLSQNVATVMEQSEVVLARGFSEDPRVSDPAPENRSGTIPEFPGELVHRIAGLSAWCMGSAAGAGQSIEEIRRLLRPMEKGEASLDTLPGAIIEGYVQGSGIAGSALAGQWDTVGPRLDTVVALIGEQWGDPEAAALLRESVQVAALAQGTLVEPVQIGRNLVAQIDLGAPRTVKALPGTDRLIAYLRDGKEAIGEARIGIIDEIPADDWLLIALNVIDHALLEKRFPEAFRQAVRRLRREVPESADAATSRLALAASSPHSDARLRVAGERRNSVPVLMYHAIANQGPPALDRYRLTPERFEQQMRWLSENGYHTITSVDLARHLANHEPFHGRPVIITFDDGMQNFADHAWPILRKYGFVPEMFIVTDRMGQTSDWDAEYGSNYPLMDEATIRRLAGEGVIFGSHMATHPKSNTLDTAALLDELERSRDTLTRILGAPPPALAAPYGIIDLRYAEMARRAGYYICYTTNYQPAYLGELPLQLPRLEVFGDFKLADFANSMKGALLPTVVDRGSDDLISVVVPADSAAATIEATLSSLAAQSHQNLEIIVVDDGSTDDTVARAQAMAATEPRLRIISQPRSGLAAARNTGWRAARGAAIAFVDADDLSAPDNVRLLYSALQGASETAEQTSGKPPGLAYGWSTQIDARGDFIKRYPVIFNFGDVLADLMAVNFIANASASMVWRHVLEAVDGFAAPRGGQDVEGADALLFHLRVAERYGFVQVAQYLTQDRQRPRAVSGYASRDMRTWYVATDEIVSRHPELKDAQRRGAQQFAMQAMSEAIRARRALEFARLVLLVAPRDPALAARLPVVFGVNIGRRLSRRFRRMALGKKLGSAFHRLAALRR